MARVKNLVSLLALGTVMHPLGDDSNLQEKVLDKWSEVYSKGEEKFNELIFEQSKKNLDKLEDINDREGYQHPNILILKNKEGKKYILDLVDEEEVKDYPKSEEMIYEMNLKVDGKKMEDTAYFIFHGSITDVEKNQLKLYDTLEEAKEAYEKSQAKDWVNLERLMWSFGVEESKLFEADGISVTKNRSKVEYPVVKIGEDEKYGVLYKATPKITFYFKEE